MDFRSSPRAEQSFCCQCSCTLCGIHLSDREIFCVKACRCDSLDFYFEAIDLTRNAHLFSGSGFCRSMHLALFSCVHTDRKRLFKDRTSCIRNLFLHGKAGFDVREHSVAPWTPTVLPCCRCGRYDFSIVGRCCPPGCQGTVFHHPPPEMLIQISRRTISATALAESTTLSSMSAKAQRQAHSKVILTVLAS